MTEDVVRFLGGTAIVLAAVGWLVPLLLVIFFLKTSSRSSNVFRLNPPSNWTLETFAALDRIGAGEAGSPFA